MKYFHECKTIEEVKALYKQLAKQHHPDCGGDNETMQEINEWYDKTCIILLRELQCSEDDFETEMKITDEYRQVIVQLINLPGIAIELVGHWIWVTGLTFPVKKQLKEAGLRFAPKKVAWYYRPEEYKTRGSDMDLEQIKAKYGSETVNNHSKNTLLK